MLNKRVIKDGENFISHVLIQWKGPGLEAATWEEEFHIKSQLPQSSLEGKATIEETGIN